MIAGSRDGRFNSMLNCNTDYTYKPQQGVISILVYGFQLNQDIILNVADVGPTSQVGKEGNVLLNDALNTFIYGFTALDI